MLTDMTVDEGRFIDKRLNFIHNINILLFLGLGPWELNLIPLA